MIQVKEVKMGVNETLTVAIGNSKLQVCVDEFGNLFLILTDLEEKFGKKIYDEREV